jgi:glycosyltransferase involved in cell wall biosynthesis
MKLLIAIPAYNEADIIQDSIKKLHHFLSQNAYDYDWKIVVSNNASTDQTEKKLSEITLPNVIHRNNPTRSIGESIDAIFKLYDADIYGFIDADLSVELIHIKEALDLLEKGEDVVTASRRYSDYVYIRKWYREIPSSFIICLTRLLFKTSLTDFQAGFKFMKKKVRDSAWTHVKGLKHSFINTEILILSSYLGFKVKDLPVNLIDTRKTKIPLLRAGVDMIIQLFKLRLRLFKIDKHSVLN